MALAEDTDGIGGGANCVDPSRLALAIFGAIFGTLLLCTGFALAIWYLVRNHHFADKLFCLERQGRKRKEGEEKGMEQQSNSLDEVDNLANDNESSTKREKMDLAHQMSITMEKDNTAAAGGRPFQMKMMALEECMDEEEEKSLEKEEENHKMEQKGNEKHEERGNGTGGEEKIIGNGKESGKINNAKEVIVVEQPKVLNNLNRNEMVEQAKWTASRHGTILDPLAIGAKMSPIEEEIHKNGQNKAPRTAVAHKKSPSENSMNGTEPEMTKRLRTMLSAEQFGMLETNRRRLEQERRQLRELGVI